MVNFEFNLGGKIEKIEKYWNFCICTCHAYTLLRGDVRKQLIEAHKECGFKFVRFHDLFNDDMSVVTRKMDGSLEFSYFNIDNIYDFILANGMKPFIEIGFMPTALASGASTIYHYQGNTTLPRSYDEWKFFIQDFVNHLIKRYGLDEVKNWYFEFWNEPNIAEDLGNFGAVFFSGSKEEYFEFYKVTYKAIKEINEDLQFGGPATSNNKWVSDFLKFSEENNITPDFVSTHQYPADCVICSKEGRDQLNEIKEVFYKNKKEGLRKFLKFRETAWENVPRGELSIMAKSVRNECGNMKLFYTEWSSLAGLETDNVFGSSFIVKTAMDNLNLVDGYGYWTLSDIFEESGQVSKEFHGGYGLFTYHSIKKAPYNAFKLLNLLPETMYENNRYNGETLDIWSFKKDNDIYLLLNNHNSLMHDIKDEEVKINLKDIKVSSIERYVIDEEHSNAANYYLKKYKGKDYLSLEEIEDIKKYDNLVCEELDKDFLAKNSIVVRKMGTVLLKVTYERD